MCFRIFFSDGRVYIHHLNPQEKSVGLVLAEDFWGFAQAQAKTTEPGGATDSRGLSASAGSRAVKLHATLSVAPVAVTSLHRVPGHCHSPTQ